MSVITRALEKAGRVPVERQKEVKDRPQKSILIKDAFLTELKSGPRFRAGNPKISKLFIFALIGSVFLVSLWALFFFETFLHPSLSSKIPSRVQRETNQKGESFPALFPKILSQTPEFLLTGITSSGAERLALINGQVVGVGDRLKEKALVKDIREQSVTLDYSGKRIKLSL